MKMMKRHPGNRLKQKGMTLIELLIAGVISLIAASGMILVMASTLGTGAQTIQMANLTREMRTAMQIMSRELRRANYHATFMSCYGQVDCLTTLGLTAKVNVIGINGDSDCFWFWYDRPQTGTQVAIGAEPVAAFRRAVTDGAGTIQMITTSTDAPSCGADAGWVDITDPTVIDIETFNVSDAASFIETFNTAGDTQSVERIALTMTARLRADNAVTSWFQAGDNSIRQLTEFITVRNSITTKAP